MEKPTRIASRFRHEHSLLRDGLSRIAGVDEAGRGPLAGPVVAAAVILPPEWIECGPPRAFRAINDSKQLSPEEREVLHARLTQEPRVEYAVASVDVEIIDRINILQATHRAMNLALAQLPTPPDHVLIDGLPVKTVTFPQTAIVGGDGLSYSIAAASILAKVTRDRLMVAHHAAYPDYGFHEHKGYGTPAHLAAIRKFGPCPIHRRTFSPIRMVQGEFPGFPDEPVGLD